MWASCPHACITPFVWLRNGSSLALLDRQRVDVGAQRDHTAGSAAPEHPDGARLRDRVAHLDSERAELLGDEAAGLLLAVAELGLLVQLPAQRDDRRRQPLGRGADLGVGCRHDGGSGEERWQRRSWVPPVRSGRLSYAVVARRLRDWTLPGAALVLLVAAALVLPLRPHGDAGEYLLMLESWHRHGSPEWRPGDVESLRGLLAKDGLSVDEGRVLLELPAGRERPALLLPLLGLLARSAFPRAVPWRPSGCRRCGRCRSRMPRRSAWRSSDARRSAGARAAGCGSWACCSSRPRSRS